VTTLSQRIEELRTQRGLSRPALAQALGLPRTALEKFETGRQTPTKEQQEKLAAFFGVSLFYLRGESNDPTRQESWMDLVGEEEDDPVPAPAPRKAAKAQPPAAGGEGASLSDAFLRSKGFQELVRAAVLEVLRSPQGQELLSRAVGKELERQRR
jgi:transcriptional regulator with XRE-family HTH domain